MLHRAMHSKLDYILQQHNIVLVDTATMRQKNELLTALYTIQALEDYSSVIAVLESLESDEVKITTILADYCQLDVTEQLSIIQSFNPITLTILKDYILLSYTERVQQYNYKDLIPTLKTFFHLYGNDNIGHILIENDVKPGLTINVYLEYADSVIANTYEQTAANIMSLIYLTPDSIHNPLAVYNTYSLVMLKDLSLVSKIEPLVISIIDKVHEFTKASQQVSI